MAADGKAGTVLGATTALSAPLGQVAGLAMAPDGDLHIAAAVNVVKLTPGGTVDWVAGKNGPLAGGSVFCNPASQADFTALDQLAFDGRGDLLVSDFNAYGLFERAVDGRLRYLGQFRGDGAPGALVEAPDGSVVEAWREGLTRRLADGKTEPVAEDLDRALGRDTVLRGGYNIFIGGDGVAVGPDGTICVDTNTGNTFTSVSALLSVGPRGTVAALRKS